MEVARGEYGTCPAPTLKFLVLLLSNVVQNVSNFQMMILRVFLCVIDVDIFFT
jgi:hypothetical protein